MSVEALFCNLSSKKIANQIRSAKSSVCFASPGIQLEPAKALAEAASFLGHEMITVCLDFDERSMRLGYGDIVAVQCLKEAKVVVRNSPGLRTAFFIVDGTGYIFTPTALYLEAESNDKSIPNALRLTRQQVTEIQARLSPEGKAIAQLLAVTSEEKDRISGLPLEVEAEPVSNEHFDQVNRNLEQLPPTNFDVTRQVRVYESYLQYVDLSLKGTSIQRNKIKIPPEMQSHSGSKDLEGRLKTTFDLIQSDSKFSSKTLEDALNEIRNAFTFSLGKRYGRVIPKARKKLFLERLEDFKNLLNEHKTSMEKELQTHINHSRDQIIDYSFQLVKDDPPDAMLGQLPFGDPTGETIKSWLRRKLNNILPTAESLIRDMKLEYDFKDITFETLNDEGFLDSVKNAFPDFDWDKAHEEFLAAGEGGYGARQT